MAPKLRLPPCTCGGPKKGKGKGYCVNAACREQRRKPTEDIKPDEDDDKETKVVSLAGITEFEAEDVVEAKNRNR